MWPAEERRLEDTTTSKPLINKAHRTTNTRISTSEYYDSL
jgi:hypothetical protein